MLRECGIIYDIIGKMDTYAISKFFVVFLCRFGQYSFRYLLIGKMLHIYYMDA